MVPTFCNFFTNRGKLKAKNLPSFRANSILTLLHSERPKFYTILAFLGAICIEKALCEMGDKYNEPPDQSDLPWQMDDLESVHPVQQYFSLIKMTVNINGCEQWNHIYG